VQWPASAGQLRIGTQTYLLSWAAKKLKCVIWFRKRTIFTSMFLHALMARSRGKDLYLLSKCEVHSLTGHEGPEGEYRCSCTLSLTSALNGGHFLTSHPCRFTPGKETGYSLHRRPSAENLASTGIRSPDRLDRDD
jgi:hypothetical protein